MQHLQTLNVRDLQGSCNIFLFKNKRLGEMSWKLKKVKGFIKSIAEILALEEALQSYFMIN